ncbi:MAG: FAD-dependent oxidoreductase [Ornithinimicrobium sp.]
MDPVIVVGAGLSGVACAQEVRTAGHEVVLLDRGRQPGGRMAIREIDGRPVDTGASYFTVSDESFATLVRHWSDQGLAHRWTDTFDVFDHGHQGEPKVGNDRWAARWGLRSLVEDLASDLDLERHTVESVTTGPSGLRVDGRPARAVVLAMPDPQARRLLDPSSATYEALDDSFEPVLALSAGWTERSWDTRFEGAFVNGNDRLAWIADDGRRRGDGAAVLVAHSTPALAAAHLDAPQDATEPMLQTLSSLLGITTAPEWTDVHRWTFARPTGGRDDDYHLGVDDIGVCGDAWSQRPRVEAAYLSGRGLGAALVARLDGP